MGLGMVEIEQTPLQACAEAGGVEIGRLLAKAGASVDLQGAAF
jgi:hypothetical protein